MSGISWQHVGCKVPREVSGWVKLAVVQQVRRALGCRASQLRRSYPDELREVSGIVIKTRIIIVVQRYFVVPCIDDLLDGGIS